jgi:hypothetical protein
MIDAVALECTICGAARYGDIGDPMTGYDDIAARASRLAPREFMARISELVRGGHTANSIPEGSRSSDKPGPELDAFDVQCIAARDGYRRIYALVQTDLVALAGGDTVRLHVLSENVRKLDAWERWALATMGVDVDRDAYRAGDKDAAKAMSKAREKANKELAGTVDRADRFECVNCHHFFKRTKTQRPRAGRCTACYQYRRDTGADAAAPVVDHRVERDVCG